MRSDTIEKIVLSAVQDHMPDALDYDGDNMLLDGSVDSFSVVELTIKLGELFGRPLDPKLIVADNFCNVRAIIKMAINFWGSDEL